MIRIFYIKDSNIIEICEEIRKELDDLYGEGGANSASTLLVEKLQTKVPGKYKEMITNLNNLKKKKS